MEEPPVRTSASQKQWRLVFTYALGMAVGVPLSLLGFVIWQRDDVTPMLVLAIWSGTATVVFAIYAVYLALLSTPPTFERGEVDGKPAVGIRAVRAHLWLELALDLVVGLGLVTLCVLGLRSGDVWTVWSLLGLLISLRMLGKLALAVMGRRHHDALWLTEDEIVGYDGEGVVRTPRSNAARVTGGFFGSVPSMIVTHEPVKADLIPRPWRRLWGRRPADQIAFDFHATGHDVNDANAWLGRTLGVEVTRVDRA